MDEYGRIMNSLDLTDKEWLVLKLRKCESRLKEAEELLREVSRRVPDDCFDVDAYFERHKVEP